MKKIIEFFKKFFCKEKMTAEEERELITKIIKKIKES